jgi:flagellar hook-associated protein 3 FlgL
MSNQYQISFTVTAAPAGNVTTYNLTKTMTPGGPSTLSTNVPYVPGQPIVISTVNGTGDTENVTLAISGTPQTGDAINVTPYDPVSPLAVNPANGSLFELMDKAINGIKNAATNAPGLAQSIAQALTRIDAGMDKLLSARAQAGIWLNRADTVSNANDAMSTQLETDRSNAEDLDMVKGVSDMEKMKTGYQVAMQSYAQIQKLSLFDYIR